MEQGGCNADRGEVLKLVDFSEEQENWGWRGVQGGYKPPQSSPESGHTGLPVNSNQGQGPGVLGWVAAHSLSGLHPQETWEGTQV